jgi:hypothetical protein
MQFCIDAATQQSLVDTTPPPSSASGHPALGRRSSMGATMAELRESQGMSVVQPHSTKVPNAPSPRTRPRLKRTNTIATTIPENKKNVPTISAPDNSAIAEAMAVYILATNAKQWGSLDDGNTTSGMEALNQLGLAQTNRGKGIAFNEPSARCPPRCTPTVVQAFIEKLNREAQLTVECNICAMVYAIRFLKNGGAPALTQYNWRPILSTAFLIASKVWDDLSMLNKDFSIIFRASTTLKQVNMRETNFLKAINWDVNVAASQYTEHYFRLREHSSVQQAKLAKEEDKIREEKKRRISPLAMEESGGSSGSSGGGSNPCSSSMADPFSPRTFGRCLDLNSPRARPLTVR